jgi:hypothetical protein
MAPRTDRARWARGTVERTPLIYPSTVTGAAAYCWISTDESDRVAAPDEASAHSQE